MSEEFISVCIMNQLVQSSLADLEVHVRVHLSTCTQYKHMSQCSKKKFLMMVAKSLAASSNLFVYIAEIMNVKK